MTAAMARDLLTVDGLCVCYGGITAVRDVTFKVREGEIVAVIGSNGAGKSSIVNAVVGLVPSTGRVRFDGADLSDLGPERMAGRGITLVPEGRRVFPELTVRENLLAGGMSRTRAQRKASMHEMLDLFPSLRARLGQSAGSLSGGEQQMLAVARALMCAPRMLLLDEPSLGLAPQIVDDIFALLLRLRDGGVSILLVEQNAERAVDLADRTIMVVNGGVHFDRPSGEIRQGGLKRQFFARATT